ncbi:TetR/AcrR family transcriptional regulator [Sphingobium sp. LB126]|uniref:TetR/AcrR family transcriptional regulator n=1 Tax=Sphingobium sp. LB126 TaxID=1983755 RepID=UPI0012FDDF85|nr:TetR/AcrR family transcriptional regulator [Sphingobium sp. LB126]
MPLSTKNRILDVAARLFARTGIDAVSMQEIMREAGVNVAAINYHFGSKENLVSAMADREAPQVAEHRLTLLSQCADGPGRPPLIEQIVEAFVRPTFLDRGQHGSIYGRRTMAILNFQGGETYSRIYNLHFLAVDRRFIQALVAALPGIPLDAIHWRYASLIAAVMYAITGGIRIRHLSKGLYDPTDIERAVREIVSFQSAAFRAEVSDGLNVEALKSGKEGGGPSPPELLFHQR